MSLEATAPTSTEDRYEQLSEELTQFATALVGADDAAKVVADAFARCVRARGWTLEDDHRSVLFSGVFDEARSRYRSSFRRQTRKQKLEDEEIVELDDRDDDVVEFFGQLSFAERAAIFLAHGRTLGPDDISPLIGRRERSWRRDLARAERRATSFSSMDDGYDFVRRMIALSPPPPAFADLPHQRPPIGWRRSPVTKLIVLAVLLVTVFGVHERGTVAGWFGREPLRDVLIVGQLRSTAIYDLGSGRHLQFRLAEARTITRIRDELLFLASPASDPALLARGEYPAYPLADEVRTLSLRSGLVHSLGPASWILADKSRNAVWLFGPPTGNPPFVEAREVGVDGRGIGPTRLLPAGATWGELAFGDRFLVWDGGSLGVWDARMGRMTSTFAGNVGLVAAQGSVAVLVKGCSRFGSCSALTTLDIATGRERSYGSPPGSASLRWLWSGDSISPDRRRVAVTACSSTGDCARTSRLFVVDLETGSMTSLQGRPSVAPWGSVVWSSTGAWIIYQSASGYTAYRFADHRYKRLDVECCGSLTILPSTGRAMRSLYANPPRHRHSTPTVDTCPEQTPSSPGPHARREATATARAAVPELYGADHIDTRDFEITSVYPASDAPMYRPLLDICGYEVRTRSWVVEMRFPKEGSSDLGRGIVFATRFGKTWKV